MKSLGIIGVLVARHCARRQAHSQEGRLQKAGAHFLAGAEKCLHFLPQRRIGRAGLTQIGGALPRRRLHRLLQNIAYLLPAFRCHG